MNMKGKVVQIMPAPSNLFAVYNVDGEDEEVNVLCITLTDRGEIALMDMDDDGNVGEVTGTTNLEYVIFKKGELKKIDIDRSPEPC